jgi:AcrR family transcriptional regulator
MAAIAEHSDVAVQSLYLRFGSKFAILKAALDAAVVGDLEPVPLLERPWVRQVEEAEDGRAAVRLFVAGTKRVMGRTYPIYAAVHRAAAGEAGELLAENRRQRYQGNLAIAEMLSRKAGFSPGLAVTAAADRIFGLVSEDHYGLLVVERGWSPDQWEAWCADLLAAVLFPGS